MKNPIVVDQASNALTQEYDGVIEAVHRLPDGKVEYARLYLKRGATWSDHQLISRDDLIAHIKAGKKYILGERKALLGSTFTPLEPIHYQNDTLLSGSQNEAAGDLADAPVF